MKEKKNEDKNGQNPKEMKLLPSVTGSKNCALQTPARSWPPEVGGLARASPTSSDEVNFLSAQRVADILYVCVCAFFIYTYTIAP